VVVLDIVFSSHAGCGRACVISNPGGFGYVNLLTPSTGQFLDWYLWILLASCFDLLIALGLSCLVSSRSTTIGVLLPFQFIVSPLLSNVTQLGGSRQAFFTQSLSRLSPRAVDGGSIQMFGQPVTTSLWMSWFVIVIWVVVLVAAGAWVTFRRDA
jgi:hypothetical protein